MRTTIVSTSKLKTHKVTSLVFFITLYVLLATTSVMQLINGQSMGAITTIIVWSVLIYKSIKLMLSLKNISYDGSSVYYQKDGFEVQIPFEDIKDIEIKTMTGIYIINLFQTAQDGKAIPFKMSLWYPFNFKKQDEKVNELRDKIDRYKRTLPEKNFVGLSSYNI